MLSLASQENYPDVVRYLVSHSAKLDELDRRKGHFFLFLTVGHRDILAKEILEKTNVLVDLQKKCHRVCPGITHFCAEQNNIVLLAHIKNLHEKNRHHFDISPF